MKNPNLKEKEKEGRYNLVETNQTPPSALIKDQPEAKISNNLRKKKKVRRSVAKQQIQ